MIDSFRSIENWQDYTLGCPEGTWNARLDNKAWGKSQNLILYFSEIGTDQKYWLSVFAQDSYCARDRGFSFRDIEPGAVFELITSKSKAGYPKLESARQVS
jgi:hypothetical protein